MKFITIFIYILFCTFLYADSNVIELKDNSGLSDTQLREKVNTLEENSQVSAGVKTAINAKNTWENSAPTPVNCDWVELTSGEWIRGSFKTVYEKELEFDSKEFDLQTFDFEDVSQVRTHKPVTVSIQTSESEHNGFLGLKPTSLEVTGILRIKDNNITIIQGEDVFHFTRDELISIANGGDSERQYYSGKVSFNFDVQTGNTNQFDYGAIAYVMRRTSKTRLRVDYVGNISSSSGNEISNNHRVNEKFDLFLTQKFYITALGLEYYNDVYQNIDSQWTLGAALGYTLIDSKKIEWDISAGPAILATQYNTVEEGSRDKHESWALQIRTLLNIELTKKMDVIFDYRMTKMDKESGDFRHHMLLKSENEITSWFDFDVTFVWDYLAEPTRNSEGLLPYKNDYQLLVGFGVDF